MTQEVCVQSTEQCRNDRGRKFLKGCLMPLALLGVTVGVLMTPDVNGDPLFIRIWSKLQDIYADKGD